MSREIARSAARTRRIPARESPRLRGTSRRCRRCRFVYLRNPPDYETLAQDFSWDKTFTQETERRRTGRSGFERSVRAGLARAKAFVQAATRRDKLKRLCADFVRPGSVLDLGCSRGYNAFALPSGRHPARNRDRSCARGGVASPVRILRGKSDPGLRPEGPRQLWRTRPAAARSPRATSSTRSAPGKSCGTSGGCSEAAHPDPQGPELLELAARPRAAPRGADTASPIT